MEKIIHRASDRGFNNLGWLKSYHSFSFSQYYNPEKMNFGLLRVLNDDHVDPRMGFGTHPHDNMEIVSIPLEGVLVHQDSIGNKREIKTGDVQIMSAGTGVKHSEFNGSEISPVKFLQIWVFPKEANITPNYAQQSFNEEDKKNRILNVVSPDKDNQETVWINQDAWFSLSNLDTDFEINYDLHLESNGVYVFVLEGEIEVGGETLNKRDAIGLSKVNSFSIKSNKESKILLIEVPMDFN